MALRSVLLHFDGSSWTATTPPQYSGYSGYTINDVWTSSTGQAYAVSDMSGWPVKWNPTQAQWEFETVTIPEGKHSNYRLNAIYGFADNDVYAVGTHGTITTPRAGPSWPSTSRTTGSPASLLQTVWGYSADAVFAGGNNGQLYRVRPATSSTWETVNQGNGSWTARKLNMLSMYGTGANDIWFVGGGGGHPALDRCHRFVGAVPRLHIQDPQHHLSQQRRTIPVRRQSRPVGELQSLNPGPVRPSIRRQPSTYPWKTAAFTGRLWLALCPGGTTGLTWDGGRMTKHPVSGLVSSGFTKAFQAFSASGHVAVVL